MMRRPKQRSKGELPGKYPGKLGRRRAPTEEQKLLAAIGTSAIEQELAAVVDAITNASYYDEGIALLVKHLGVKTEFHGVRETAGYFWQELAVKLLQRHVPYFMPPAQRGAPATLQSLFPMLDMLIQGIKQGDAMSVIRADHARFAERMGVQPRRMRPVKWTVYRAYMEVARLAGGCGHKTVEREFARWKRARGNSAK